MTSQNIKAESGWKLDNSYTKLPKSLFAAINPSGVSFPEMVVLNHELAESLGLNMEELRSKTGLEIFAGNWIPEGAQPIAQAYAGHQFGHFTMLGDGRALLLGEQITPKGERMDIQLKGSGRTPYSRGGDGRAALGPMLREFIISEAMHALGIPTTRSLAVVATGETVFREKEMPGAVLTRVAASHIRVGTFQFLSKWRDIEELKALANYTIDRHFSGAGSAGDAGGSISAEGGVSAGDGKYLYLLKEVIKRQAELIAKWMLVGFIHGVMNTDNMAISGETIDYGPCAFMDTYDPETVFSSIDMNGRYAYGNQPGIAAWNLARFAETLLPLLHEDEKEAIRIAEEAVSGFDDLFMGHWLAGMRAKLGLFKEEPEDEGLIRDLLASMLQHQGDYTNTFRGLTLMDFKVIGNTGKDLIDKNLTEKYSPERTPSESELFASHEFARWYEKWQSRLSRQHQSEEEVRRLMKRSNPGVIPRNHRVEEALGAAWKDGDLSVMERLFRVISDPYAYSPEQEEYAKLPVTSNRGYRTFCGT